MSKKWTVKVVDFDRAGRVSKDFRDCVGMYDHKTDTIYVDSKLPTVFNGTVRSIFEHEKVHARVYRGGFKLPARIEERLATLLSVCPTPSVYQAPEQVELKRMLCKSLRWPNALHRELIVRSVLAELGIYAKGDEPLVRALAE